MNVLLIKPVHSTFIPRTQKHYNTIIDDLNLVEMWLSNYVSLGDII